MIYVLHILLIYIYIYCIYYKYYSKLKKYIMLQERSMPHQEETHKCLINSSSWILYYFFIYGQI